MGWLETDAVDERMKLALAARGGEESFTRICRRFGVSRKTGYKWLERYEAEGPCGLADRSRATRTCPHALDEETAARCARVRAAHPSWGPLKVKAALEREGFAAPAASTIGSLFDRLGLTVRRPRRRRAPPRTGPFAAIAGANDTWTMDFKGWFRTGDGDRCEPFTLIDAHSRYLLRLKIMKRADGASLWPVLDAAFREYGLPARLRSDNGAPFASTGAGGLTRFAVNLIKAGVALERIRPGKPQENGRHERLHLTLKRETATPPAASLRAQAARFRAFERYYNEERPHQALGTATPAERYAPSARRYDGTLREPEYDAGVEVRRVRTNGEIKWRGRMIYLHKALIGEPVALAAAEDGAVDVRYGPLLLGRIDRGGERLKLPRAKRRAARGSVENARAFPTLPQASSSSSSFKFMKERMEKSVTHPPGLKRHP